jgi:hypothetical protein
LLSSPVSCVRLVHDLISAPDQRVSRQRVTTWVALLTGVTLVVAGLGEVRLSPLGAARVSRLRHSRAVRARDLRRGAGDGGRNRAGATPTAVPAATLLAVTMLVAITCSGIGPGDVIPSLAPALLLATLFLLVRGLGLGGPARASRAPVTPLATRVGTPVSPTEPSSLSNGAGHPSECRAATPVDHNDPNAGPDGRAGASRTQRRPPHRRTEAHPRPAHKHTRRRKRGARVGLQNRGFA